MRTGHRFAPKDQPDTAAMVLDGITSTAWSWHAEVLVRAPLDEVALDVPANVGTLEAVEGGTLVRMGANELDWIARFLARIEHPFEVVSPPELKDELPYIYPSVWTAYREIVPTLWRQRKDPTYFIRRELPPVMAAREAARLQAA